MYIRSVPSILKLMVQFFFWILSIHQDSRRAAFAKIAGTASAIVVPLAANAAAGESPRFSVFGLIGEGDSYSEGAAYGSDQSTKVYSPYSVYGDAGADSLYQPGRPEDLDRLKSVVAESIKRLDNLPAYIEKKEWFNVKDELTRYMYETRGAVRNAATTPEQKALAASFFKEIETTYGSATQHKQEACASAAAAAKTKLSEFYGNM